SVGRFFAEVLEPSTVRGYYMPLSMTSLMLDAAAGGRASDLTVFHRTNLALHVACTLLVALILCELLGSILPAAILALLFGLHPLAVEPVAWVAERKTLLAAWFAFASTFSSLRSARTRSRRWLTFSIVAFALALLSKPSVVALPLMFLALDLWP